MSEHNLDMDAVAKLVKAAKSAGVDGISFDDVWKMIHEDYARFYANAERAGTLMCGVLPPDCLDKAGSVA